MENKIKIEVWPLSKIKKHLDHEVVRKYQIPYTEKYDLEKQDFIRTKVCLLPEGELAVIYLSFWENLYIRGELNSV